MSELGSCGFGTWELLRLRTNMMSVLSDRASHSLGRSLTERPTARAWEDFSLTERCTAQNLWTWDLRLYSEELGLRTSELGLTNQDCPVKNWDLGSGLQTSEV